MRFKPNELVHPRLGLIVAKKTAKLAVNRNYMRRVLRELFRLNQHNIASLDLVIQVQKKFDKLDFFVIKKEFNGLLNKLPTNAKVSDRLVGERLASFENM